MGTNKVVEVVAGRKLKLKSSADFPMTPNQRTKLLEGIDLSDRVVRRATMALRTMRAGDDSSVQKVRADILAEHFKVVTKAPGPAFEAVADPWERTRRTIVAGLDAIALGLRGELTIADAYSSTHSALKKSVVRDAITEIEWMHAEKSKAERDFASSGDMAHFDRIDAVDAQRRVAKAGYVKAMRDLEVTSRNTSGFVQHRVVDAHRRTDPAAPVIAASEKGSIHINFQTLLSEPKYSLMNVAVTIIHEAAHKFIDAYDFAYAFEPHYKQVTADQSLRNADSYALAAVSLSLGRVVRTSNEFYDRQG